MAKNNDYSKKLFRFVRILNKLETEGKVATRSLAVDFNVSMRTAQRSIEVLNQAGYPLYSPAKGIYSFVPGFSLRRLPLNGEEASLLAFLCEVAQSMGGRFARSFRSLSAKAVLGMPGDSSFHSVATVLAKKDYPVLAGIQSAIEECREINIDYSNGNRHRLRPLKIVFAEGFWYLIATKKGKKDVRTFRLDRINSFEPLRETFVSPRGFMRRLGQGTSIWAATDAKREIKVSLAVSPNAAEYFRAAQYLPRQKIVKTRRDGSLLVETIVSHFMEVIPVVQRWIPHVKVIRPRALRDEFHRTLRKFLRDG